MKSAFTFFPAFLLAVLMMPFMGFTQHVVSPVPVVVTPTYFDISPPLRDIPVIAPVPQKKDDDRNSELKVRSYPNKANALPKGPDGVWQQEMGTVAGSRAPLLNFEGNTNGALPPDCNGEVNANFYFQSVNISFQIFNKTGTSLYGPAMNNTLWTGLPGASNNGSDPVVLYDQQADRWFYADFTTGSAPYYIRIAVSQTNDPTGSWYRWTYLWTSIPDFAKYGIWQDGYYMGANTLGNHDVAVFERAAMIAGNASPKVIKFTNPSRPFSGFHCILPFDNDGIWAPAGTPGQFITINDDAWGGMAGDDQLWLYTLTANWVTPASSTFYRTSQIFIEPYDSDFGTVGDNITQPGTSQKLDAVPLVLNHRAQYRNFGSYQSIVCCHTVDVDFTNHAGTRWYELRNTGSGWYVFQQGTYAPDAASRWMGSIAQNQYGDIALGYSVSSSTVYPSIRYTGRRAGDTPGTMSLAEQSIMEGQYAQTTGNRWGDYANMSVDPENDQTFWFTSEYIVAANARRTRIAQISFGDGCSAAGGCSEYISRVQAGTIDNTTACLGYADYADTKSTNLSPTGSVNVTITNGAASAGDQCGLWVDWNRDGDFSDANETIPVSGTPGPGPYTALISPPAGQTNGQSIMRVRITRSGLVSPCGTTAYGEVEDYTINVTDVLPLTGTKTIPGNYATIAAAISDLNLRGVGTGGVTFNIAAGYTETFITPDAGVITASGTLANPVVFHKSGTGANPVVTAAPGTGALDGIIVFSGSDYFTFDGLDLMENPANTNNIMRMEWGYALLKASLTAPYNGCQQVTIKNCTISLDKVNYLAVGIYAGNHTRFSRATLPITTSSDAMNDCKFFSNTISDVYTGISLNGYDAAAPSTLFDQRNEIGKDGGNTITDFGGNDYETSVILAVNQDKIVVANNVITGGANSILNGINVKKGQNTLSQIYNNSLTLTGSNYVYPITDSLPSGYNYGTVNIYNNTISNCHTTGGSSAGFFAILQAGGNTVNIYSNTISHNTHHSGSWYGQNMEGIQCYYGTNNVNIYSNVFSYNTLTGGGTMAPIVISGGYSSVHDNLIHHNSITDPGGGGFSYAYMYGIIFADVSGDVYCNGNEIHDLYVDNTNAGYGGYIAGIFDNGHCSGVKRIYSNTIFNLQGSYSETAPVSAYGMRLNWNYFLEVYGNKISNISNGAKTGNSNGLHINNLSNTAYIYNNSIAGIYAPYATGVNAVYGINLADSWAHPVFRLYSNSVYLDGSSLSAGNFGSSGLFVMSNINLELKNNMFINTAVPNGTGKTVAYSRSDDLLTFVTHYTDNNNYFAGTPGPNNLIFTDGTNSFQTIADYITFMSTVVSSREIHSITENPPFVNVATQPYDIHINAAIPTLCESAGTIVNYPVVITTDIDNQPRYPNAGYPDNPAHPATAPDIGSDEFAGMPLDLTPPTIDYTPIANTNILTPQTLYASIYDANGIPVAGIGLPVLYWNINGGTWNACQGVYYAPYNQYTFTFGSGVVPGDLVSYYLVAQDNAIPIPNMAAAPASGASGFTANPPACTTLPDVFSSYTVLYTMCGNYTVGTGGDFSSLTGSGGLFEAINSSVLTCNIFASVTSNLDEDGSFALNQWLQDESGDYTLTILPADTNRKTISGASKNSLIRFDGAQRVIIDGGYTRSLLFRNSYDAGADATISYESGCQDDLLTNCIIEGNSVNNNGGVVNIMGFGSFNITVSENLIRNPTDGINGPPANGIYCGIMYADSVKILHNNISNWKSRGIFFGSVPGRSRIAHNSFYFNLPDASDLEQSAIYVGRSANPAINSNFIGGQAPMCGGLKFQHTGFSSFTGINLNLSSGVTLPESVKTSPLTVNNNVIQNININNDPSYGYEFFTGIRLYSGLAEIGKQAGNLIGSLETPNSITINGTGESYGIYASSSFDQSLIENNIISHITLTASDGPTKFTGIYTNAGKVNKNRICNIGAENTGLSPVITGIYDQCSSRFSNMFNNNAISLHGGASLNPTLYGIRAMGENISEFYYNSVSISGPATTGSLTFAFYNDSYKDLYLNNNVFSNTRVKGGTGTHYAIYSPNIPATWVSDYNDLFTSSSPVANWNGTDLDSLVNWVSTTGGDVNSVSENPNFVSETDLHTSNPALDNSGIFISGIETDLAGNPITDPPDMGCYQFDAAPSLVTKAATSVTITSATLHGSGDPSGDELTIYFDYGLTDAYGNTVEGIPSTISGNSIYPLSASLTGLTGNTTYHYRVRGVTADPITVVGNDLTFTTVAGVPVNLTLTGEILKDTCFNATNTIIVAGTPDIFVVTPAGHVTMIAGVKIQFLPGAMVEYGGYLLGYITTTDEYCTHPLNPLVSNPVKAAAGLNEFPDIISNQHVTLSPNPTDGAFTIELTGISDPGISLVEIYNMNGMKVITQKSNGERKISVSAFSLKPGLYFIQVTTGSRKEFLKLIKM